VAAIQQFSALVRFDRMIDPRGHRTVWKGRGTIGWLRRTAWRGGQIGHRGRGQWPV